MRRLEFFWGVTLKSKLLSGAASAALMLSAGAPALAQSPTINWTGFYTGVHAGAAWGHANAATSNDCSAPIIPGYFCSPTAGAANAAAVSASGTGKMSETGFNGGFQAGYNWQASQFVFGVEGDIGFFRLNGSRQHGGAYPVGGFVVVSPADSYLMGSSFETDWLATYRGRLGWTVDNVLFYVTGGGASTRLQTSLSFSDNNFGGGASANGSTSKIKNGWVVGGGIEWMMNQSWTVRAEYLHVDFGRVTTSTSITLGAGAGYSQGISTSTKFDADIVRLGLNYKF